ncbi:class I SAM-dependent DNA methyltransferase [Micromonospora sp. RTP1Z1]|uniref:HsdM family class I SAM-dependent methyltransferase n=1 Tax=Micromonospora sp. RTP1Z1 TaxID=2994043 RepID=UPI0029C893EC|nr:N-6 DNA methylase [Micromonospora sp. RTP1Z1]
MSTLESLMTREEVAHAAGVTTQAVSNWARRHPNFPQLVQRGSRGGYLTLAVAAWLDGRHIPRPALLPGERPGMTYGERFRSAVGCPASPGADDPTHAPTVDPLDERLWAPLERLLRKSEVPAVFEAVVLSLLCLRDASSVDWAAMSRPSVDTIHEIAMQAWRRQPKHMATATKVLREVPATLYGRHQLLNIVRILSAARAPADQVFEYLLDRFAKFRHSSPDEYLVPADLARLMVRMVDPAPGDRVHDPCCGPGTLLVAAGKHMAGMAGTRSPVALTGRAATARTWGLATMNAAIHGMQVELGDGPPSDPGEIDAEPGRFDVVLLNPPFGMRNWSLPASRSARPWPYGEPSPHNVTMAWLQTAVEALAPGGRAAVIMPYNATFALAVREREIRRAMVEHGAVRCVVALPSHMFRETTVPVTVWILAHPSDNASGEVLFVDAQGATRRSSPTHRVLTERGCQAVLDAYQGWMNGTAVLPIAIEDFAATTATVTEIREHGHDLQPLTYLNQRRQVVPDPRTSPTLPALQKDLARLDADARTADLTLNRRLERLVSWTR